MAQFLVRNLEDDTHQKLQELAHGHGQSLEEFVLETLRKVALQRSGPPIKLGSTIARRFAKIGLHESIEELRGRPIATPSFE